MPDDAPDHENWNNQPEHTVLGPPGSPLRGRRSYGIGLLCRRRGSKSGAPTSTSATATADRSVMAPQHLLDGEHRRDNEPINPVSHYCVLPPRPVLDCRGAAGVAAVASLMDFVSAAARPPCAPRRSSRATLVRPHRIHGRGEREGSSRFVFSSIQRCDAIRWPESCRVGRKSPGEKSKSFLSEMLFKLRFFGTL
jgi:hypothetical protein